MKKSVKRKSTLRKSKMENSPKPRSMKRGKSTSTSSSDQGHRKGTKRSDLRFVAPDGSEWASPFEYRVYSALVESGVVVRRTTTADALSYTTPVKKGVCAKCLSCDVVQQRVYTPDLVIEHCEIAGCGGKVKYLETKGYFPGTKRNLFRAARQSNPQVDVRLVVSSNHWVTKGKTRLTDWAKRYKIPIHVWDGKLPEDWL